jgi:hypothetical protein
MERTAGLEPATTGVAHPCVASTHPRCRRRGSRTLVARLMRPACSSSYLRKTSGEPSARIELAVFPIPGDCSASELRWRCGVIGGNRTLTSRATFSRAAVTLRPPRAGPPGRTRTVIGRSSGGCTAVVLRADGELVGAMGLEPTTSRSRTARAATAQHPFVFERATRCGGSGENRTRVLRFKRPLQRPAFATDPWPHPSESNRDLPLFRRTRYLCAKMG